MKHAVVTGAASGIGLDCCADLVQRGWRVWALDNSSQNLAAASALLRAAGDRFVPLECDVADSKSVALAFETIAAATSSVDALVCSAGISRTGPLLDMAEKDFDALFAVNTKGPWLMARAARPLLERAARPESPARIIFVASLAAIRPKVGGGAYAASKAALVQLTRVLSVEMARKSILVNAIAPSTVDTPMTRALTVNAATNSYKVSGISPLGRVAAPADITAVVRFLLSSDSNYLAGVILPVDGGTSAAFDPR